VQASTERALDTLIAALHAWAEDYSAHGARIELLLIDRVRPADLCIERWPLTDARLLGLASAVRTAATDSAEMASDKVALALLEEIAAGRLDARLPAASAQALLSDRARLVAELAAR
jgi:hypothetical protein